jgi:hypothetical protein
MFFYRNDGDEFEWKKQGGFAFDDGKNHAIHWFTQTFGKHANNPNPWGATPGDGIAIQTKEGIVYRGGALFSPEMSFVFAPTSGSGKKRFVESPHSNPLFVPFDWRSFGFAFYGDINRNSPFDKVIPNYLAADEKRIPELQKDQIPVPFQPVLKGARYFNYGGCVLCIEPDKDYWVTRARFTNPTYKTVGGLTKKVGETVLSKCTVYVEQINGFWVPVRAIYASGSERLDFQLDWKFVNPSDGKIVFSVERLTQNVENLTVSGR